MRTTNQKAKPLAPVQMLLIIPKTNYPGQEPRARVQRVIYAKTLETAGICAP